MRAFSLSDRKKLESSSFIEKFNSKTIVFTQEFRNLVLKGSSEMTREEHFNSLLGVRCFDKKYIDSCLNRWRKQLKFRSVPKQKRGRQKDSKNMTIEELRALVALQKEMLTELKKIHGLTDEDTFGF
jgi:hypothetical protein